MDRFIDNTDDAKLRMNITLKSSLDRFIAIIGAKATPNIVALKSSLDRFIARHHSKL